MTRQLSLLETRVLGTLYEKQHTVPDSYPLTLNALVSGCNQKTSRSPVMEATEAEVQAALDSLKSANLVMETSGGRVSRYSHNVERVLQVPSQSAAILTVLMLRGPQTAGELRINCDRLHSFADISAVQGFLDELAARPAGRAGGRAAAAAGRAREPLGAPAERDARNRSGRRQQRPAPQGRPERRRSSEGSRSEVAALTGAGRAHREASSACPSASRRALRRSGAGSRRAARCRCPASVLERAARLSACA